MENALQRLAEAACVRTRVGNLVVLAPVVQVPVELEKLFVVIDHDLPSRSQLAEIAQACDCSVSTVKRRLAQARKAFERLAKKDPILRDWLEDEN